MSKKVDPKKFIVRPGTQISALDLEAEEFRLPDGSRLTEEKAETLAAAAERRLANLVPGRKSLAGDGSHSPVVQFRTPRKDEGQAIADELGVSLSELARRAYNDYLDSKRASNG